MRNQRGIITVDFMFSLVLIMGFTALLFVLTFTLSIASVTQYVTFATARNYAVAHVTIQEQTNRANQKYNEMTQSKVLRPLYSNGWYSVDQTPGIGDHTTIIPGFQGATEGVNKFWGAGTHFTAKVLAFTIPFFGSTAPDDETGEGFTTYIGSYLGREPSSEECLEFTNGRWNAVRNLPSSGGASYSTANGGGYYPMADNGC
ncbi:MAG: hypothetical protein AB7F86_06505 [Bdellovibrionales bacterium]